MNFKDLFEKYKKDTATEEEKRIVEAEIEKSILIQEFLEEEELDIDFEKEEPMEIGNLQKAVRRKKRALVFAAVIVSIGLLLSFRFVITPLLNSLFYNPNGMTYSDHHNDLTVQLATYTELHFPSKRTNGVRAQSTGIGTYNFTVMQYDTFQGEMELAEGEIHRGKITIQDSFWQQLPAERFTRATYPFSDPQENIEDSLKTLPPYTAIQASLSFHKDLTMDEVADLVNTYPHLYISWVGIRHGEEGVQRAPLIGLEPTGTGAVFDKINTAYPYYEISDHFNENHEVNGEILEKHFKDLVQFQLDHLDYLEKLDPEFHYRDYYESVQNYIEESGIASYGIVLHGKPDAVLDFIDHAEIESVTVDQLKLVLPE